MSADELMGSYSYTIGPGLVDSKGRRLAGPQKIFPKPKVIYCDNSVNQTIQNVAITLQNTLNSTEYSEESIMNDFFCTFPIYLFTFKWSTLRASCSWKRGTRRLAKRLPIFCGKAFESSFSFTSLSSPQLSTPFSDLLICCIDHCPLFDGHL